MRFYIFKNYHNDLTFLDINCKVGDLYLSQKWEYLLAIGEDLRWFEDQKSEYIDDINNSENITLHTINFLSKKTINVIHILSRMYFTDIWNVIKLYIHDLENIIKYKPLSKKKKSVQELYIYSDGRSIKNSSNIVWPNIDLISSYPTTVQQSKLFWKIKNWVSNGIVCTHGIIFQDWDNLTDIYIYDSRRQYYKSQKDPRYETLEVVKVMADIYNAKLHIM